MILMVNYGTLILKLLKVLLQGFNKLHIKILRKIIYGKERLEMIDHFKYACLVYLKNSQFGIYYIEIMKN